MLNEIFRTYKKIIICVLIMMSAVVFWFFGCHKEKNDETSSNVWEKVNYENGGYGYRFETEQLSGKVVFGVKGYTVKDKAIPVTVDVNAKVPEFSGVVKITVPGSNSNGIAYQTGLQCQKDTESRVVFSIPQLGNASYFCFEILDQYENSIFSRIEVPEYSEWVDQKDTVDGQICLGVLSNQYESLQYLDGLLLNDLTGNVSLRLIPLDMNSFPTNVSSMDIFSGILIDDYSVDALNKKQRNVLFAWLKNGGNLILGTGRYGESVLSYLHKELNVTSGDIETEHLNFGKNVDFHGEINLTLNQLKFQENVGWKRVNWSEPASSYVRNYGSGRVQVLRFSFADESLLQWNRIEEMSTSLMEYIFDDVFEDDIDQENSLWNMEMALHDFNISQTPNAFYYGIFFLVYLCALAYIAYFLLRRLKKREYIWIVVPMLALFFTACVLIRSRGNSFTHTSLSAIRIVDDQSLKNDIYFLYQNAEGEGREVSLIPAIDSVVPLDYEYAHENIENTLFRKIQEEYTVSHTKKGYALSFKEASPGTMRLLSLSENKSMNYGEKTTVFDADLNGDHTSFQGKITNQSDKNFDKVVVIRGNQFWYARDVKAGSTFEIPQKEVECWSQIDEFEDVFSEAEDSSLVVDIGNYIKYRYMKNNTDLGEVVIVGITLNDNYQLLQNGEIMGNEVSVFANHVEIDLPEIAECLVNIHLNSLKGTQNYHELYQEISEKAETEAEYQFDDNRIVWAMARNRDDFTGKIYAYNYQTKEDEEILKVPDDVMNCEELEPYVSENNDMKLMYKADEDTEEATLPILSVWLRRIVRKDEIR